MGLSKIIIHELHESFYYNNHDILNLAKICVIRG
jgi:hypothetical protein